MTQGTRFTRKGKTYEAERDSFVDTTRRASPVVPSQGVKQMTAILRDGSHWSPSSPVEGSEAVLRLHRDKAIAGYVLQGVPWDEIDSMRRLTALIGSHWPLPSNLSHTIQ